MRTNVTRLSSLRRGFLIGVRGTRLKAKAELARQASEYDAELFALRDEFHKLALAHHRRCHAAAVDEAIIQRVANPGMVLH